MEPSLSLAEASRLIVAGPVKFSFLTGSVILTVGDIFSGVDIALPSFIKIADA